MKSSLVKNRSSILVILFLTILMIGLAGLLWNKSPESSHHNDHAQTQAVDSTKTIKGNDTVKTKAKIEILTRLKARAPQAVKESSSRKAVQKKVLPKTRILPTIMARPDMSGTKINLATYYGPEVLDDISVASNNPDLIKVYSRTITGVGKDYRQKASL